MRRSRQRADAQEKAHFQRSAAGLGKVCRHLAAHTSRVVAERALDLWGAIVWATYCFSFDCRFYCPVYSQSRFKAEWNRIHDLLDRLAFEQFEEYPGCDKRGCGIYKECAWALEGVEYKTPELYGV